MLRPWLHPDFIWKLSPQGRAEKKYLKVLHDFTENVIAERRKMFKENKQLESINKSGDNEDAEDDIGASSKLDFFRNCNFIKTP